jgi:hypothetical protein
MYINVKDFERPLTKWADEGKTTGHWSDRTITRIAQGLLSALRDFGVLQGAVNKKIAPAYLPMESFAYLVFYLKKHQPSGAKLIELLDWKLFFLEREGVERFLFEAHQRDLLEYHVAGSVTSTRSKKRSSSSRSRFHSKPRSATTSKRRSATSSRTNWHHHRSRRRSGANLGELTRKVIGDAGATRRADPADAFRNRAEDRLHPRRGQQTVRRHARTYPPNRGEGAEQATPDWTLAHTREQSSKSRIGKSRWISLLT